MLNCITIKNIALIEELTLQIPVGFSVLTGETGAGKSILIGALNFVLGERVSHDILRSGAAKCSVEATFVLPLTHPVFKTMEAIGLECDEGPLVLSRELSASGRNVCRINGTLISAQDLKRVGDILVDIHGQHEHQQLLDPQNHIRFLDQYAGCEVEKALEKTATAAAGVRNARKLLRETRMDEMERARRIDLYAFQIQEIDAAQLKEGEEEALLEQRQMQTHAQTILEALSSVSSAFSEENGILERISSAGRTMESVSRYSEDMKNLSAQLGEVGFHLEDIAETARNLRDSVLFDPAALEETENRIQLISDLKRKYGNSIPGILQYREKISREYDTLRMQQENRQELEEEYKRTYYLYRQEAKQLRALRQTAARELSVRIENELHSLGMPKAQLEAQFTEMERDVFDPSGIDIVEFLLSTNGGEQLRPLSKVASGGELSRIMLAFKKLLADLDPVCTMVFDEIDTGISGGTGMIVGEKMASIAADRQVLCITHLPQIAAIADNHFFVAKQEKDGRMISGARLLTDAERPAEIARIMGAEENDAVAMEHAAQMIRQGREYIRK